jgi:hypothetical protein
VFWLTADGFFRRLLRLCGEQLRVGTGLAEELSGNNSSGATGMRPRAVSRALTRALAGVTAHGLHTAEARGTR